MPRDEFHQELAHLDALILQLGDLNEQALTQALTALATRDSLTAQKALAQEPLINALTFTVRTRITTALALQAPVASDLRNLTAMQLIGIELERIGDHAKHIAHHALHIQQDDLSPTREAVSALGTQAQSQLHAALDCFRTRDSERARSVAANDDELDHAYRQVITDLMNAMAQTPEEVAPLTDLLLSAQDIEHIGDRVINICEAVIFAVTGELEDLR